MLNSKKIEPLTKGGYLPDLFAFDESSILPKLFKVVAPRGSKPEMLTTHEYKGITVNGTIDGTGKVQVILSESATNTEKTYQFLEFLRSQRPRHQIHIMLDNASFHHAKAVKETADNLSINLHLSSTSFAVF